jgi:hypothetical protein
MQRLHSELLDGVTMPPEIDQLARELQLAERKERAAYYDSLRFRTFGLPGCTRDLTASERNALAAVHYSAMQERLRRHGVYAAAIRGFLHP